ncbi:adenylyl-sulfate kinase [Campylobacter lari]|uniref:adenylyl-sulfate kinase n=1 Tax=Campylobacter lari TaxID=201 RepID=UPI001288B4CB|nr:adenylyl-sulfate kinase [Campylobacter lari]EAJ5672649.1 adenylyl-sulfate kinase [Campylobacter lari]EAK5889096.1 adenylyl-sulfate kinase [Campylobacter lari]EGK8038873.1 adenylyl-sulfate kinase [Campylobacter lari]MCH3687691.1 adenylyl-sulfate kinase [Campylobacter lari]
MSKNLTWHVSSITKTQRAKLKNQKPYVLWFSGLSGSGKSTLANAVEKKLFEQGFHTYLLDGDNIRHGLNKDLGFDEASRVENIRRIGEVCKLFVDTGIIVLCAFISPFEKDRKLIKDLLEEDEYIEIFVDTPLEVCEKRDPKGLYKKARNGEIKNFTGIDSPYEKPKNPHIHITKEDLDKNADMILSFLDGKYNV